MGFNWWYGDTDSKPRQTTSIPRQPTIHLKNRKKKIPFQNPLPCSSRKMRMGILLQKNRTAGQGTALFCTVMARLVSTKCFFVSENQAFSRKKLRKNMLKGSSSRPPINLWINQNNLNLEKTEQKNSDNKKQNRRGNNKSNRKQNKTKNKQKKTKQNTETNKQKQFSMGFPGGPCFLESLEFISCLLSLFCCFFNMFFFRGCFVALFSGGGGGLHQEHLPSETSPSLWVSSWYSWCFSHLPFSKLLMELGWNIPAMQCSMYYKRLDN